MSEKQFDLSEIESITLADYNAKSEGFWEGTRDHDVSQNVNSLLKALKTAFSEKQSYDILDFGCGPGRDLLTFKQLGHNPTGLDGTPNFCQMAQSHSGCKVLQQSFFELELGEANYDGIFANASLFHIPSDKLLAVLRQLYAALRADGVLFCSNPRGNAEGWNGDRFGHYMQLDGYQEYFSRAGFEVIDHYYRPEGLPRDEQRWLAIVSKKR